MLSKFIVYAINQLNELEIPAGKTFIQKLLYLSFDKVQRETFYIPYHYGPYSEDVQYVLNSLLSFDYIKYYNSNKSLISFVEIPKFEQNELSFKDRINSIINFLRSNSLATTKEISFFSKVQMILENNIDFKGDKVKLVKNRSELLGWEELSLLDAKRIKNYIELSKEFNNFYIS
jgi:uncharacterized protein YwgA